MFLATTVVLMPSSLSRSLHRVLEDLADVDLGDADVAVRVALDVLELGEVLRVDALDDALGDHRDAVARGRRLRRLMMAPTSVSTMVLRRIGLAAELLGDERQRRARGLADAERQVAGLAAHRDDEVPARGGVGVDHQVLDDLDADVARGLEAEGVDAAAAGRDRCRWSSGTCTTRMRPADCSSSFIAEKAVSSPPMVISCATSRRSSEIDACSRAAADPWSGWRARCR